MACSVPPWQVALAWISTVTAEAVALQEGALKKLGRIPMLRKALEDFARKELTHDDHVVIEATRNPAAVADLLAPSKDAQSGRSTSPSLITAAEISAKWSELRARISADEAAIVACRTDQVRCSPVTIRFLSIVDLGRNREGRARLGWVNRAVNMAIRPVSDWAQYGLGRIEHRIAPRRERFAAVPYLVRSVATARRRRNSATGSGSAGRRPTGGGTARSASSCGDSTAGRYTIGGGLRLSSRRPNKH